MTKTPPTLPPVGLEGSGGIRLPPCAGLPKPKDYALSHWLETVRNDPLLDYRSTESLPNKADVVIVGSGLSGAVAALSLLQSSNPPSKVVLVEARELCSGATGRNAGHCKPDRWRGFSRYAQQHGAEQALKILANEQQTWQSVVKYVQENKVDCDLWVGKTFDVITSDTIARTAAENFKAFKKAGGDIEGISCEEDPCKAEELCRVKGAKAVYSWNASTLHPWKLVAHVIRQCLDLDLNLQTWTPVRSVAGKPGAWEVNTDRGRIIAPTIVHTTNAYAGALLPELLGVVTPTPHVCTKVMPPTSHSGSKALSNSYAVITSDGLVTINPRQGSDGAVLFGGFTAGQKELAKYVAADPWKRTIDDGLVNFGPIRDRVKSLGTYELGWDDDHQGHTVRYDYGWTGIVGQSRDDLPLIGAVPGKPGQWMSCGHCGHGMARIFTASPGLVKLMQGASWAATGLPESFEITEERLKRLRPGQNIAKAKL